MSFQLSALESHLGEYELYFIQSQQQIIATLKEVAKELVKIDPDQENDEERRSTFIKLKVSITQEIEKIEKKIEDSPFKKKMIDIKELKVRVEEEIAELLQRIELMLKEYGVQSKRVKDLEALLEVSKNEHKDLLRRFEDFTKETEKQRAKDEEKSAKDEKTMNAVLMRLTSLESDVKVLQDKNLQLEKEKAYIYVGETASKTEKMLSAYFFDRKEPFFASQLENLVTKKDSELQKKLEHLGFHEITYRTKFHSVVANSVNKRNYLAHPYIMNILQQLNFDDLMEKAKLIGEEETIKCFENIWVKVANSPGKKIYPFKKYSLSFNN